MLACRGGALSAALDELVLDTPPLPPSPPAEEDDALRLASGPPISPLSFGADASSQSFTCLFQKTLCQCRFMVSVLVMRHTSRPKILFAPLRRNAASRAFQQRTREQETR